MERIRENPRKTTRADRKQKLILSHIWPEQSPRDSALNFSAMGVTSSVDWIALNKWRVWYLFNKFLCFFQLVLLCVKNCCTVSKSHMQHVFTTLKPVCTELKPSQEHEKKEKRRYDRQNERLRHKYFCFREKITGILERSILLTE